MDVDENEKVTVQKKGKKSRDDHETHFTFGSDTQRYPNSEQVEIFPMFVTSDINVPK